MKNGANNYFETFRPYPTLEQNINEQKLYIFHSSFQTSHTCVYFTKVLWPEFSAWDLISAVFYYQRCYSDIAKLKMDHQNRVTVLNNRTSNFVKKLHKERELELEGTSSVAAIID